MLQLPLPTSQINHICYRGMALIKTLPPIESGLLHHNLIIHNLAHTWPTLLQRHVFENPAPPPPPPPLPEQSQLSFRNALAARLPLRSMRPAIVLRERIRCAAVG
jgi:hypothetical protein